MDPKAEAARWLDIVGREFFDNAKDSKANDVRLYRMVRKMRAAINTTLDMRASDPKIARILSAALDYDGKEGKEGEEVHLAGKPAKSPGRNGQKISHPKADCQVVVGAYLEASGKGDSDIAKDPGGWGRWMIEADKLLAELGGRVDLATECIQERAKDWKGVADWTMAGVTRRAKDWLAEKQAGTR